MMWIFEFTKRSHQFPDLIDLRERAVLTLHMVALVSQFPHLFNSAEKHALWIVT